MAVSPVDAISLIGWLVFDPVGHPHGFEAGQAATILRVDQMFTRCFSMMNDLLNVLFKDMTAVELIKHLLTEKKGDLPMR